MDHNFRIINDCARSAGFNMAADRYLLDCAAKENTIFLRTYSWAPSAISLGLMQRPDAMLDIKKIVEEGVEWTARPTGGRAMLHWNDLTYASLFHSGGGDGQYHCGKLFDHQPLPASRARTRRHTFRDARFIAGIFGDKTKHAAPLFFSSQPKRDHGSRKKACGVGTEKDGDGGAAAWLYPFGQFLSKAPAILLLSEEEKERQSVFLEKKCICVREIDPTVNFNKLSSCLIKGFSEILPFSPTEIPWDKKEISLISKNI